MVLFLVLLFNVPNVIVEFSILSMAFDRPGTEDLLFRSHQAHLGTQSGKQLELTGDSLDEQRRTNMLLRGMTGELRRRALPESSYRSPSLPYVASPIVHVDVDMGRIADELKPEFQYVFPCIFVMLHDAALLHSML